MTIFDLLADALPLTGKTNDDLRLIFGFCAGALLSRKVMTADELSRGLQDALSAARVGMELAERETERGRG